MNRTFLGGLVAATCLLTVTLASRDAHALGPVDLEIAAKGGVGTAPSNVSAPNPLGFGLGGRAGVAIAGFYGGVSAVYYLGGSQDTTVGSATGTLSRHALLYGVEGGYGWKLLDLLTIRPQIGVGQITVWTDENLQGGGNVAVAEPHYSNNALYIEPGVTAMISLGTLFVGADVNALVIPSLQDTSNGQAQSDLAFTAHAQVGVKF